MDWAAIGNALLSANWVSIISIVSSAIVAIVSTWAPARLEKQKSLREEARRKEELRRNELAEIDQAAEDFLSILSTFRGPTLKDVEVTLTKSQVAVNVAQVGTILQSKFYVWEIKVWKELSASDHSQVKTLRSAIETTMMPSDYHPQTENPLAESMSKLADQVMTLTRRATGRE